WYPIILALLCTVANASGFRVRIGGNNHHVTVMSAAVLVAAILEPVEWVTIGVAVSVLLSSITSGILSPLKISFNVAKDTLASFAAAMSISFFHVVPGPSAVAGQFGTRLMAMFAAAAAYAIVDETLFHPVIATATRTSAWTRLVAHWDVRILSRLGAIAIAVAATIVIKTDRWLLVAMPILLYMLYLISASRVRSREEREAWQQLARTTDELNDVDLHAVLHSAVHRAAELFSADELEVLVQPLNSAPARLVRGNSDTVTYDGPPGDAPISRGTVIPAVLESHDGESEVGELRLRFRGKVQLSERETYTLRTFAAALCTAIRNASAYAEAQRLAESHARNASIDPLTGLANRRQLQEYSAD